VTNRQSGEGGSAVSSQQRKETKGVVALLGEPKKAIIKLALPILQYHAGLVLGISWVRTT